MARNLALLVVLLVLGFSGAQAAVRLDHEGCLEYAVWSRDVVWARDVGADKAKVRASLEEIPGTFMPLVILYFDSLWATAAPRKLVAEAVYRDCVARRGNYGDAIAS